MKSSVKSPIMCFRCFNTAPNELNQSFTQIELVVRCIANSEIKLEILRCCDNELSRSMCFTTVNWRC